MQIITDDLIEVLRAQGVTEEGIQIVFEVAELSPVRRPRASKVGKNRTMRYPSKKNGFVIHTESETLEFAGALILEFDDDVIYYFAQPPAINLRYKSGKRMVSVNSVLDFFVISKSFVGYVEWKNAEQLTKLSKKSSDQFYFDEVDYEFYSPAIERALEGTGFSYKVCYEKHAPPCLISNLEFLNGYFSTVPESNLVADIERVIAEVKKSEKASYQQLCQEFGGDSVNYALARREIFFPLDEVRLIDTVNAVLFSNEHECNKFRKKVSLLDKKFESCLNSEVFFKAKDIDISRAVKRLEIIELKMGGELTRYQAAVKACVDVRTISRWQQLVNGLIDRTDKLVALIDKNHLKGNRGKKLDKRVDKLIKGLLEEFYLTKIAPNAHFVYGVLKKRCASKKLPVPSTKTFYAYVNALSNYELEYHRRGEKAAYQHTAFELFELDDEVRLGATRFLQYCHFDHTKVDLEVFSNFGVEMPNRIWITLIVDEFTGMILATYLSYHNPSYVSLMMAIRLMVLAHGVLPECVVVDGGKEFQGTNFELFTAAYRIIVKSRQGQPRGMVVERVIGILNTTFFHNIEGNTKFTKDIRSLSATHNPKKNAKWTLSEIAEMLEWYVDACNNKSIRSQTLSPVDMKNMSQKLFGQRVFLNQKYDDVFYRLTLPNVQRGTVTLRRGKNVQYDNLEYWNTKFHQASKKAQKLPAKWDPLDAVKLFVFLDGEWIKCNLSQRLNRPLDGNRAIKSEELWEETRINLAAKRAVHGDLTATLESAVERVEEKRLDSTGISECSDDEVELEKDTPEWLENIWSAEVPSSKFKGGH